MLASLKLEMAYFSGLPLMMPRRRGGAGIILKLQRVRPARRDRFQPLKSREITPEFLDAMLCKLRRWKFDIVGIDEACRRAGQPGSSRRFVCLTFDGGYGDLIAHAYPVLARHAVPFAVYLPTAFPDGVGEAWWLALEAVIAGRDRISRSCPQRWCRFLVGFVFRSALSLALWRSSDTRWSPAIRR
jgi:hypothetical protein